MMRKIYRQIKSCSLVVEESSLDVYTKLITDLGIPEKPQNQSDEILVVTKTQKKKGKE